MGRAINKTRLKRAFQYGIVNAISVLSLSVIPVAQADTGGETKVIKKIGDLEIYTKSNGGISPSILLTLDLSASMWATSDPTSDRTLNARSIPSQDSVPESKRLDTGYNSYGGVAQGVSASAFDFQKKWIADDEEGIDFKKCDWGHRSWYDKKTKQYQNYEYSKLEGRYYWWNVDEQKWVFESSNAEEYESIGRQQVADGEREVFLRKQKWDPSKNLYRQYCKKTYSYMDKCTVSYGENVSTFSEGKRYTYTDPIDQTKSFTIELPVDASSSGYQDGNPLYGLSGCQVTKDPTQKRYNRSSTLKDSLLTLLTSNDLDSNIRLGLATYSELAGNGGKEKLFRSSQTGTIVIPVKSLTLDQRRRLAKSIVRLVPHNSTPTAPALAESGAYMLGTSTMNMNKGLLNQIYPVTNFGIALSANRYQDVTTAYQTGQPPVIFNPQVDHYIQGAGNSECSANGIYLMTDGMPSEIGVTLTAMNNSLAGTPPIDSSGVELNDVREGTGWNLMAKYAKRLREGNTPKGIAIKVATAGLGDDFAGIPTKTVTNRNTGEQYTQYQCHLSDKEEVSNLCKLGENGYGYGEGGFSHLTDANSIYRSITNFISSLNNTLPTQRMGEVFVPDDPLSTTGKQAIAYVPMIEPKPAENLNVWAGNLKKYVIEDGNLFGKNNQPLFDSDSDRGELNTTTQDLWSDKDYTGSIGNSHIKSGGVYAHLKTPASGVASVRTVYVEDSVNGRSKLKQFSVNSDGKITVDGNKLTNTSFDDSQLYNGKMIGNLLQFLGFSTANKENKSIAINSIRVTDLSDYQNYTLEQPTQAIKLLGASPHSTPVNISYGAGILSDQNGRIQYRNKNDYLLFGSMDGALHLVDANNSNNNHGGQEKFALLTKTMLTAQPNAIVPKSKATVVGVPKFGVDAPWVVKQNFKSYFSTTSSRAVSGNVRNNGKVMAYGGFRMGAEGLYAIDITNVDSPDLVFKLDKNTPRFDRLGQVWSQPTLAKIKRNSEDKGTDVLIFGGGYDTCYEDETYQVDNRNFNNLSLSNQRNEVCKNNRQAIGNAVYMVNAETGDLIWSTEKLTNGKEDIKHSVVAQVVSLDRNNDGFLDHIYFADLGGQLFRVDFNNADYKRYSESGAVSKVTDFSAQRIVRLYHDSSSEKQYIRRFYGEPMVSMQQDRSVNHGQMFAVINLVSGDRSSPLSKIRTTDDRADRVYGIFDFDITKPNKTLYQANFVGNEYQDSDLFNLNKQRDFIASSSQCANYYTNISKPSKQQIACKQGLKDKVKDKVRAKKGWYYPFVGFDGYTDVLFTKGIGGRSEVIANNLYISVYNPNMAYSSVGQSCTATVKGASESRRYCLPYGICDDNDAIDGVGGYNRLGGGIQELILGPRGGDNHDKRERIFINSESYNPLRVTKGYGDDGGKNNPALIQNQLQDMFDKGLQGTSNKRPVKAGSFSGNGQGMQENSHKLFRSYYTIEPIKWYSSSVLE